METTHLGLGEVSPFLQSLWLWVCVSSHLLKEEVSLMMAKQDTHLGIHKKVTKNNFILLFID